MSLTPRTDAQEYYIDGHYHVSSVLARELELDGAGLRKAVECFLARWDAKPPLYSPDEIVAEMRAALAPITLPSRLCG